MNNKEFWTTIESIINNTRNNRQVMTGLPAVDESVEENRFIRAIEILVKAIALHDLSNDAERQALNFLDGFGMNRSELIEALQNHWARLRTQA